MLRIATLDDIDFLYLLYMHPNINSYLLYEQMDLSTFISTIQNLLASKELYIFENDKTPVGMCKLVEQKHRNSHCLYLGGLAVHPDYIRQGFGDKLMQEIIHLAKSDNKKRIELSVAVQNKSAISLYKKNGFVEEGVLKYYTYLAAKNEYIDEIAMAYYNF